MKKKKFTSRDCFPRISLDCGFAYGGKVELSSTFESAQSGPPKADFTSTKQYPLRSAWINSPSGKPT